jgi:hypothetical protein
MKSTEKEGISKFISSFPSEGNFDGYSFYSVINGINSDNKGLIKNICALFSLYGFITAIL